MLAMMGCSLLALTFTYTLFTLHAGRPTAVLVTGLLGVAFTATLKLTGFGSEESVYLSVLQGTVDMRGLLLAGIIIGATGFLATRIETSFIGGSGTTLSINQTLPAGTSLESTDATAKRVESLLSEVEGVKSSQAVVGGGGGVFGDGGGQTDNRAT